MARQRRAERVVEIYAIPTMVGRARQRVLLKTMNEDDLNSMEPIPWYRRAWPWLFFIGIPVLVVFAQLLLRS